MAVLVSRPRTVVLVRPGRQSVIFRGTLAPPTSGAAVTSVAGRTGAVTLTSLDLTDTTAAGRALLDDANAAAQRTTLGAMALLAPGDNESRLAFALDSGELSISGAPQLSAVVGVVNGLADSAWAAGTSTTKTAVSPAQIALAMAFTGTPLGNVTGTVTLDMQGTPTHNRFTATATADITIAFDNIPAGIQSLTLDLTGGGDHIVTYPGSVVMPASGEPELTSDTDVLLFETLDGGSSWKLFLAGRGYSA